MKLQRYEAHCEPMKNSIVYLPVENGEWVKHEDHQAAIESQAREIEALKDKMNQAAESLDILTSDINWSGADQIIKNLMNKP